MYIKSVLIKIILFLISIQGFGQEKELFLYRDDYKLLEITLCPDYTYFIIIKAGLNESRSLKDYKIISFGSFKTNMFNKILLKDTILNKEITLVKKDSSYQFKQGFEILKRFKFNYDSIFLSGFCKYNKSIIDDLLKREEIDFLKAKIDKLLANYEFELRPGMYCSYVDHELNIKENGEYEYYIFKYLTSVGKWEKEGNWLKLHDADMDVTFYMAITGKNKLRSLILPGDYEALKFYRILNDPIINYRNASEVYLPKHNR